MLSTDTQPEIPILYEDPHLLVVNKPSNLLSQKDHTGDADLLTLCKIYLQKKKPGNKKDVFLGLTHRLDRPVSGLMILAKTKQSASGLSRQIRKREIRKIYQAVVHGKLPPNGAWVHHLEKDNQSNFVSTTTPDNRRAKLAELGFIRLSYDSQTNTSLVKINLLTGRPHQIRVQFADKGYPVYGDVKYGKPSRSEKNLALHAFQLIFSHPVLNKKMNFSIPVGDSPPWGLFS